MGIRETLRRIEVKAEMLSSDDFCSHFGPLVFLPDGSAEIEHPEHDCGRPRLRIVVTFANRPCRRSIIDAVALIKDGQTQLAGVSEAQLIEWAAEDFELDQAQLRAALSDSVMSSSTGSFQ
ncbi:MAG: hypothetical protein M3447_01690 [Acidobacteriota bacterium]|nr:hypothetical protein [Acidobacteriota bacterium]